MTEHSRQVTLQWLGGLRFEGGAPGGPTIVLDAGHPDGPSPVHALMLATASCTAADVVSILEKMKVKLRTCDVAVEGERRQEHPRRLLSMHFGFTLAGDGLDEAKARRAIDLSIEKYCSVMHSLAPDLRITYALQLA